MSDAPERVAAWRSAGAVELVLHRQPRLGAMPVLLVHGASARHETFTLPRSFGGAPRSLAAWLHHRGFDPWLLDWRGSARVVDESRSRGLLRSARHSFDLDHAADHDLPEALARVEAIVATEGAAQPLVGIVGHCMGAAVLAQAIAKGTLGADSHRLRAVLLALGLFYDAPAQSQFRSQDHLLERLLGAPEPPPDIDPRPGAAWPRELDELYANLPSGPRHRAGGGEPLPACDELCNRLSFLYGRPYLEENLFPTLHRDLLAIRFEEGGAVPPPGQIVRGAASGARAELVEAIVGAGARDLASRSGVLLAAPRAGSFLDGEPLEAGGARFATCTSSEEIPAELSAQFGAIPLRLYVHAWRNLRRGWAAPFGAGDDDRTLVGAEARGRFGRLGGLLLLTGERNPLWHRRSIDRMYEWLVRGPRAAAASVTRRVLRGYGHQDLLWGRRASDEVFPWVESALRPRGR